MISAAAVAVAGADTPELEFMDEVDNNGGDEDVKKAPDLLGVGKLYFPIIINCLI